MRRMTEKQRQDHLDKAPITEIRVSPTKVRAVIDLGHGGAEHLYTTVDISRTDEELREALAPLQALLRARAARTIDLAVTSAISSTTIREMEKKVTARIRDEEPHRRRYERHQERR